MYLNIVKDKALKCNLDCNNRGVKCNICVDHDCFEKKQEVKL